MTESVARSIAYDISRLFLAPTAAAPRGIDRIDLALACHVFRPGQFALGVLPTPWGVRVFEAGTVRKGLAHLRRLWAEDADPDEDRRWAMLRGQMRGEAAEGADARLSFARKCLRLCAHVRETGVSLGRPVRTSVPKGSIYLNVGQIGLAAPFLFDWLATRDDVTAVLMLHDTIPIDYPECVEPASRAHHARMIRTAASHGHGLVVTTEHARETVCAALARYGARDMPVLAGHLPLAEAFAAPIAAHQDLVGHRYFVVCGTVEPRKNQAMLLRIWRRLAEHSGGEPPHLVIVGSHGYRASEILAPLQNDRALAKRVHHVSGLSTPALAQLLRGARALLVPSLSEGFGLPLLEARALGVRSLASDIPSHREIAGTQTTLLDCADEDAWFRAIRAALEPSAAMPPRPEASLPPNVYCEQVIAFAKGVAQSRNITDGANRSAAAAHVDLQPAGRQTIA
jgi:glycosyltransferase involved in cell wall biosynthesis